jgi:hypothetical protein
LVNCTSSGKSRASARKRQLLLDRPPAPEDEDFAVLRDVFQFHPLALEDSEHFGQRAKLSETAEYADGCVVTVRTRALEFGYPLRTRSVGVHFTPWGLAPFLPMPAAELRDRPVTVEQVWGRPAIAELRDRLARFAATVFAITPSGPIDWGDLAGGAATSTSLTSVTSSGRSPGSRRPGTSRSDGGSREHPGHELDSWPLPAD